MACEIRPWHGGTGEIGGIIIFSEDITDRKWIEKELKESELRAVEEKERLSCLLNSISDEVWFADINGQFTLANPSDARRCRTICDQLLGLAV